MNNEEQLENKEQMKCQFDDEKYNKLCKDIHQLTKDVRFLKNILGILFILSFISFLLTFN